MHQATFFEDARSASASISACGRYRFTLHRQWNDGGRLVNFVMLNPSTADASNDDRTVSRCVRFGKDWGYDGLVVTNLFAWRSTKPNGLMVPDDPIGPDNDTILLTTARTANLVVAAWGVQRYLVRRAPTVRAMLVGAGIALHCLELCHDGDPQHPLFVRASATPRPW